MGAASDDQSGRKVIVQKKPEARTRKLRKKARGSSRQCKDGRAGIKRTLMENDETPWLDARCSAASPAAARSFLPGSPCTEEWKWASGKQTAGPGATLLALREGAPGSILAAAPLPTPPPSRRAASAGPLPSFSCKCSILFQTVPARRGVGAQWT